MKTLCGVATAIAVGCVALNFSGAIMFWLCSGNADWWAATRNSVSQVLVLAAVTGICYLIARTSDGERTER